MKQKKFSHYFVCTGQIKEKSIFFRKFVRLVKLVKYRDIILHFLLFVDKFRNGLLECVEYKSS